MLLVVAPRQAGPDAAAVIELASALAGGGRTVAVVEADLRHPALLSSWGTDQRRRRWWASPGRGSRVTGPGVDGVTIFPARRVEDPRALLSGEDARTFLKGLREQFSHVVVLAPPVLVALDALELLGSVDGVIVATSRADESVDVSQASETVVLAGGTVLGAVTVVARRPFSSLCR